MQNIFSCAQFSCHMYADFYSVYVVETIESNLLAKHIIVSAHSRRERTKVADAWSARELIATIRSK